jgi:hypothetical protein
MYDSHRQRPTKTFIEELVKQGLQDREQRVTAIYNKFSFYPIQACCLETLRKIN